MYPRAVFVMVYQNLTYISLFCLTVFHTGFQEQALLVSTDLDHKFELAVALKKLDVAYAIAKESESEAKWKLLGDLALSCWNFAVC